MKKGTKILAIIDRSGSMSSIITDAIGGYNTFLNEQKSIKEDAEIKIIQFDNEYNLFYNGNIQNAPLFDRSNYIPRGSTALLDAIGKTINDEVDYLASISNEERYEKYMVIILTDGEENSSQEYTNETISKLIETQEKEYEWEFVFLAANQDAFTAASNIGISGNAVFNFSADSEGTRGVYATLSKAVGSYRTSSKAVYDSTIQDLKEDEK